MSFKSITFICAMALLQYISAQYLGACNNYIDRFAGPYAGIYEAPLAYDVGPYDAAFAGYGAYDAPFAAPYADAYAYGADAFGAAPFAAPYYDNAYGIPVAGGFGPASLAASNGCSLAVTSSSPIAPTGVTMVSENAYDGLLAVTGAMPFLGAVALEGALPTVGSGAVTYGCGNGNVGITSEDFAAGYSALAYDGYGPAYDRFAYGGSYMV